MTSVLANVSLKIKMTLMVSVFTLLVGVFAYKLLTEWKDAEYFSQKELYGTEFYAPSFALIRAAQLHRSHSIQVALGDQSDVASMAAAGVQLEAALLQIQALEQKYASHMDFGSQLSDLSEQWKTLKSSIPTLSPTANFAAHNQFIASIKDYIEFYSDQSNLTLDPEVATFYLMQLASFTFPDAIEYSSRLRGEAAAAVLDGDVSDAQLRSLAAAKPIAEDHVQSAIRSATKADAATGGILREQIAVLNAANIEFSALVQQILDTGKSDLTADELFEKGSVLIDTGYALAEKTVPELQRLLAIRIDAMQTKNRHALTALVVAFTLALLFTVILIRSILTALKSANQHLASIQQGNLENRIAVEGSDEMASLMRGIGDMQTSLRETREREQAAAAEAKKAADETRRIAIESKRIADALEVCDTSVMLADSDFNIAYMNKAVKDMLSNREQQLAQSLPGFSMSKLMGANMDIFHKNPAHQRDMVGKLKGVYRTAIKTGDLTFQLTATPLFDAEGKRTGTVVEWSDLTDRLAREHEEQRIAAENLRVRIALENSSTNTMIADANNNIIFMNATLKDMMQRAEADLRRDLPNFAASKLMGANMDVFHKNPSHQQHLIRNLKSTYRAKVEVGGRTFSLIANPVVNDKNERLGTVVEWADRTQEVMVEQEVAQLVDAASSGDFTRKISEQGKEGFFAVLAKGLNQLMTVANDGLLDVARVLSALARGDLTERVTADYEGLFAQLKDDANTTVDKLEEVITSISEAASAVATGANEIASGNTDLSQRTEEQASSLEETASSMEEMTSTVKQTSDNAQHANQLSDNAVKKAESGGAVVRSAVTAMAEINSSSKKIADIIGVIDEIAFQTNLLALNAAVEAARAGEQGRGFAVVAGEVRNLAQRSAGAAKQIKDLIRDSVLKVEAGTSLVNESGTTLNEIVDAIRDVSNMISDINAAAREQSSSIVQINQAVTQMDEMTQQNAALVEEASAAGEAMSEQARGLMDLMGFFTLENRATHAQQKRSGPARTSVRPATPNVRIQTKTATRSAKGSDEEWEEF